MRKPKAHKKKTASTAGVKAESGSQIMPANRIVTKPLAVSAHAMKHVLESKKTAREFLVDVGTLSKNGKGLVKLYRELVYDGGPSVTPTTNRTRPGSCLVAFEPMLGVDRMTHEAQCR